MRKAQDYDQYPSQLHSKMPLGNLHTLVHESQGMPD